LFWVLLAGALAFFALPTFLLLESLRLYLRTTPEDPGLAAVVPAHWRNQSPRPVRVETVPHRPMPDRSAPARLRFVHFSHRAPAAKKVFLSGDFNRWRPDTMAMTKRPGGDWVVVVPLPPGRYRYRFVVDGAQTLDPANPDTDRMGAETVSVKTVP